MHRFVLGDWKGSVYRAGIRQTQSVRQGVDATVPNDTREKMDNFSDLMCSASVSQTEDLPWRH